MLAVSALLEGRDRVEVAALFQVSVRAVDNWWARWQAGGRDAPLSRPRGRRAGEHQVLSEAEQAVVRQAVLDHTPSDLGLSGQLWTRGLLCRKAPQDTAPQGADPGPGEAAGTAVRDGGVPAAARPGRRAGARSGRRSAPGLLPGGAGSW